MTNTVSRIISDDVPPFAIRLLNFIGGIEAPRGYDTIYGNNQSKLPKPLTQMTIAEVMKLQPSWTKLFGSSAAGRYQFMLATLRGLVKELGLDTGAKFDAGMQDRLGYHLLKRRGYDRFVAGEIGVTAFGKLLSQEWASFPVLQDTKGAHRYVKRGQSYYAGDGLNKALVTPERVEAVLRDQSKAVPAKPPVLKSEVKEAGKDAGKQGILALIVGAIVAGATWLVQHPVIAVAIGAALVAVCVFGWRWWKQRGARKQEGEAAPISIDAARALRGLQPIVAGSLAANKITITAPVFSVPKPTTRKHSPSKRKPAAKQPAKRKAKRKAA